MDIVYVVSRVLFAFMLVTGGLRHFQNLEPMTGYAQSKKVPAAKASVALSGLALLAGGLSIILGVWADLGSLVSAAVLLAMALFMHNFWAVTDPMAKQVDQIGFFKNVSMAGGALFMFAAAYDGNFGPEIAGALFGG